MEGKEVLHFINKTFIIVAPLWRCSRRWWPLAELAPKMLGQLFEFPWILTREKKNLRLFIFIQIRLVRVIHLFVCLLLFSFTAL